MLKARDQPERRQGSSGQPLEPQRARDKRALFERDGEIEAISAALTSAAAGIGRSVAVLGPPGVGKTRLMETASGLARSMGFVTLEARGTPLEAEFAFGTARQLFSTRAGRIDRAELETAMTGAGAHAVDALEPSVSASRSAGGRDAFPVIHGLYWTLANLAERRPVVVIVDDLHWADDASIRWLAYTARRLEGVAAGILYAVRTSEWSAVPEPLSSLLGLPETIALTPGALSAAATAQLVEGRLGRAIDPELASAAYGLTGGNPLYLQLVLDSLATRTDKPSVEALREVAGSAILPHLRQRLAELPHACVQLAEAAAILGDRASVADCAALARLDPLVAADETDRLVATGLVVPGPDLRFIHPLARDAVERQIGTHRRAALSRNAADVLISRGAPAERIAAHLFGSVPANDARAAEALVEAGRVASQRGEPALAIRCFRRALDEAPAFPDRADAVRELGMLEATSMDREAERHLREAISSSSEPSALAEAARSLAYFLMLERRGSEAISLIEHVLSDLEARDREATISVLADLVNLGHYVIASADTLRPYADRLRSLQLSGSTPAERSALGSIAMQAALDGEPSTAVIAHAESSLAAPAVALFPEESGVQSALLALFAAGAYDAAFRHLARMLPEVERRGSFLGLATIWGMRAMAKLEIGVLRDAEADVRAAIELGRAHDYRGREPILISVLVRTLLELGRTEEADAELLEARLPPNWEEAWPALPFRLASGRLRLAQGRSEEAVAELRRCADLAQIWSLRGLFNLPWRSELALALGPGPESRELVAEELAIARAAGALGPIAVATRAAGLLAPRDRSVALLQAAVESASSSPWRLEYARALIDLGSALRRSNRRIDARHPLRLGIDLAHRCGAQPLVETGTTELRVAGGKPRRLRLSGVDALTASELRVAQLAAEGRSNRGIAQTLFITTKTVETHLYHVFAKLGVESRGALRTALVDTDPGSAAESASYGSVVEPVQHARPQRPRTRNAQDRKPC